MTFYGLADYRLRKFGAAIESYVPREVLTDEPESAGELGIVPVEFPMALQIGRDAVPL